jgi:hypothetical protein
MKAAMESPYVLCGWGTNGGRFQRDETVRGDLTSMGIEMRCLGTNGDGSPMHPLFVPYVTRAVTF